MLGSQVVAYVTYGIDSLRLEYPDAAAVGVDDYDGCNVPALRIYQLAVASGYERNGIGSPLMDRAFQIARRLRETVTFPQIVVTSYPDATGFYERFGFERASTDAQRWVAPNVLMVLALPEDE